MAAQAQETTSAQSLRWLHQRKNRAATSLALGNIDIDQAVLSTIAARIAAAKVLRSVLAI
jgi:hypothetical protein